MSQSTVANRYAQAIYELALSKNLLAEVGADLREIKTVVTTNEEFMALLTAPKISTDRKKELIAQILTGAQPIVVNMVQFLIEKKRLNELTAVEGRVQLWVALIFLAYGIVLLLMNWKMYKHFLTLARQEAKETN